MSLRDLRIEQAGTPVFDEQQAYLPFLPALNRHIIEKPEEMAAEVGSPGAEIYSGALPNAKGASLIKIGERAVQQTIGAYDLVATRVVADRLEVMPASKKTVADDGSFLGEGAVVWTTTNEEFRFVAPVKRIDSSNYWQAQRLRTERRMGFISLKDIDLGIFIRSYMDLPAMEVEEVDDSSGLVLVAERTPVFYSYS